MFPVIRNNMCYAVPEFNRFDRIFTGLTKGYPGRRGVHWAPAVDVSEKDDAFVVNAEVPGLDKEDIEVTLSEGLLTIRGEKKFENGDDKTNYRRVERRYGSFARTLRIPDNVQTDAIDAAYKDGVLRVTLPKRPEAAPKRIEINEATGTAVNG